MLKKTEQQLNLNEQDKIGDLENDKNEIKKTDPDKIETLMNTGNFKSVEDAEVCLEQLNKAFLQQERSEEIAEQFTNDFNQMIEEAENQIKSIEKLSDGKLVDRKEVFQGIINGISENFEDLQQELKNVEKKEFSLVEIPIKMGRFVRDNKLAFMTFGLASLAMRMGSSEAEASETDNGIFEVPDDVLKYENIPDNDDVENVEEIIKNMLKEIDAEETDGEKNENTEITKIIEITEKIEAQKNQLNVIFQDIYVDDNGDVENQNSNIDTGLLIDKINKNGEIKLHVLSLITMEDGDLNTKVVISPFADHEEKVHEYGDINAKTVNGVGNTEDQAIINAIQECANFQEIIIYTKTESSIVNHNDSYQKSFTQNSKQASDQIITITGINVEKQTIKIGEEEQIMYQATITSK